MIALAPNHKKMLPSTTIAIFGALASSPAEQVSTLCSRQDQQRQQQREPGGGDEKEEKGHGGSVKPTVTTTKTNPNNNINNNNNRNNSTVDLAYSADASMLVVATEDKRLNLWRRAITIPTSTLADPATSIPGNSARREAGGGLEEGQRRRERGETGGEEGEEGAGFEAWSMIGMREVPKKPTRVLFAKTPPIDEGVDGEEVSCAFSFALLDLLRLIR